MRIQVDRNTNTIASVGFEPTPQTVWHISPCILVPDAHHGMAAGGNFRFECIYSLLFRSGYSRVNLGKVQKLLNL
jgi:hypothetical protein